MRSLQKWIRRADPRLSWFWVPLLVLGWMLPTQAWGVGGKKVWTDTPDWASASSHKDVTWQDVIGQIQLIKNPPKNLSTPYIYIPNSADNTVTQLSTKTGQKNWTVSLNSIAANGDPSRTTVDPNGDVWVGLRNTNKVAWISAAGQLKKVVATGQRPRAITIDLDGNVWVGNYDANTLVKLNGQTGDQILSISMPCPYGAAADINGNIWVVNRCGSGTLSKVSKDGKALGTFPAEQGYGIATDALGQVWVAHLTKGCLFRFSNDGQSAGCIPLGNGCVNARGVAIDGNGNAWVACSNTPVIVKVSSAGQVVGSNNQVGKECVGMAVDVDGHVWTIGRGDSTASKVNATSNVLVGKYSTHGSGPYTYSDMTGFQFQITAKAAEGYWRAIHSSKCLATWTAVKWTGQTPPRTSIEVRARTAHTQAALAQAQWSAPLQNGQKPPVPANTWIEVEVKLHTLDSNITPFVTDVTVEYDAGGEEICNGKDDDCDGFIDNIPGTQNPITRECKTACGTGLTACAQGDWQVCTARYPSIEVCNGIDDDCNGQIDEGAGGSCPGGTLCLGGVCLRKCVQECPARSQCQDVGGNKVCVGDTPCDQLAAQCKAENKICRNGRCVDACDSVVCPDGFFCEGGHCEKDDCYSPKRPCPPDQICQQGKCAPNPCTPTTCSGDQACKNGQCVSSCKGVDCGAAKSCREGKCVADPCAGVICNKGEVCVGGKCTGDPCATAACRSGQTCINGQCFDDPCNAVRCPAGQICTLPHGDCNDPNPGKTTPTPGNPDGGNPATPDDGTLLPPPPPSDGGFGVPPQDLDTTLPPLPPGNNGNNGKNDPRCPGGGQFVNGQCVTGSGANRGGCVCEVSSLHKTNPFPLILFGFLLLLIPLGAKRRKP